jgi:hypothetical protein
MVMGAIEHTMSLRDAAPVAKQGLPKKPCKNRTTRNPAKLLHTPAIADKTMKIANVLM